MNNAHGINVPPVVYWLMGFFAFLIGLRWFERVNLYIPYRAIIADPSSVGLRYEDIRIAAEDGPVINAWYVENRSDSPVLLYCHGNGGNMGTRVDKLRLFHQAGASVLSFDYRGYGRSTGSPTEQGTYRDAQAAYSWLTEVKKIPAERIVLCGESLGNGVAIELALRRRPRGLIVESAFTSIVDMGRKVFPFLPVEWMVKFRYDNLAKLPKVSCPVLIMHSPEDNLIPFEMGKELFAAAREPKFFFELKGDHNAGFLDTGPAYVEAISRFLKSL